jgi:hypothetical protein
MLSLNNHVSACPTAQVSKRNVEKLLGKQEKT